MGDRLISAEELKRELSHAIWLPEWEHIRDKILKDIDLQPTAYDPDKVVEQLKVETVERIEAFLESNDKERADLVYGCFRKAIEIVENRGAK